MRYRLAGALCLLLVAAGFAGCGSAPDAGGAGAVPSDVVTTLAPKPDGSEEVPIETPDVEKTIRIGIRFFQPGIGVMPESGRPTGLDVDIAVYIARDLGYSPYEIEWVRAHATMREDLLLNDEVDIIVAAYSITPAREEVVDFAGPYVVSGWDLLVRADEREIVGVDTLAGKRVCSISKTSSLDTLRELAPQAEVIEMDTYVICVEELIAGNVDAVTTSNMILAGLSVTDENFGKVRLVGEPFTTEYVGVGLPKGSTALCEKINVSLAEMVRDGSWQRFVDRNLGGIDFHLDMDLNPPELRPCR